MIAFEKMHGNGNDFVVIDALTSNIAFSKALVKKIANINDCATNNDAFLLFFEPILLPIKVLVPAVNPTPIAIIVK